VRLSVCIPAYQAARYLGAAIDSVLAQVDDDTEVVVVDDGSTDGTANVGAAYGGRIRVLRQTHGGIGMAFNTAVAATSGELLTAIDADDLWLAGKTDAQRAAMAADPSLDAVFGHAVEFVSPDVPPEVRQRWRCNATPAAARLRGTMMLRRSAWDRVGPLPTDLRVGEFVAWYARAVDLGLRTEMLLRVVLARRIHGQNTVLRASEVQADYLRLLKATLDRRRTDPAWLRADL
jgi:glycosyltransferase involved in cell wall biosynthesis